jgi:hypothetical protein
MAGIQFLGRVGATGTATGPHKHVYVKDLTTNQYLDPATIRTPLMGLRVGEQRTPVFQQTKEGKIDFNPSAGITLTSRYGPRTAPTAGASTYHRGEDWALPEGTPVYYQGGGKFVPKANQGGYGNLATLITPDQKYEIGIGHMQSLGGASELPGAQPSQQPKDQSDLTSDLLANFLYQAMTRNQGPTQEEKMQAQLLGSLFQPRSKGIGQSLLESYMASPLPGAG